MNKDEYLETTDSHLMDIQAALEQAQAAFDAGDPLEAQLILDQVVSQDPRCEQAWLLLSRVVSTPAEMAECLRQVIIINPENRLAKSRLEGLAWSLRLDPRGLKATAVDFLNALSEIPFRLARFLDRLLGGSGGCIGLVALIVGMNLFVILLLIEAHPPSQEPSLPVRLAGAWSANKAWIGPLVMLGFAYLAFCLTWGALAPDWITGGNKREPGSEYLDDLHKATEYKKGKQWDLAIETYSQAIRLKPDGVMAYFHRAACYAQHNQPELAAADYRKVLQISAYSMIRSEAQKGLDALGLKDRPISSPTPAAPGSAPPRSER